MIHLSRSALSRTTAPAFILVCALLLLGAAQITVSRTADGHPDLSGVWRTAYDSADENERLFGSGVKAFVEPGDDPSTFSKYFLDILVDFPRDARPMRPISYLFG